MPNGLGATPEEIAEYEKTFKAAQKALGTMKSSPFTRANFDKAIADLESAYGGMKNPPTKGNPMFDWPRHLKNMVDRGLTVDVLPQLQEELSLAEENLRVMKEIRKNNVKRMFPK